MAALARGAQRGAGSERLSRCRDLERLELALAAHDPQGTLSRGYALVHDGASEPITSAAAAAAAGAVELRFHDGTVGAEVRPA